MDDRFTSCKFLKLFCKRHRLSFPTMRKKKRSDIDPRDFKSCNKQMFKALQRYPKEFIFNMDETAWNFIYKRGEVVAKINEEKKLKLSYQRISKSASL